MLPVKQLRGVTVSSTPPSNPRSGDRWLEVDSNGRPLYGWDWIYNGHPFLIDGSWASPRQLFSISYSGLSITQINYFDVRDFRLFVETFQSKLFVSSAQSSSNRWNLTLNRTTASNVKTALASYSTQNNPVNQFVPRADIIAFSGIQPTSAALIEILASPTGSPGTLFGSVGFTYYFVRN